MSDLFPELQPETRRWMFWLARIFGKRLTGVDGNTKVVIYQWRGKLWVVE